MPLQSDFLNQIVNLNWGGSFFVAKAADSYVYHAKLTAASAKEGGWKEDGAVLDTFGGGFANCGVAFAMVGKSDNDPGQQTFIMSAKKTNDNGDEGSVVLTSVDGKTWQVTWEQYEVNEGLERSPWIIDPTGCVWDEDNTAFYAAFYTVDANFPESGTVTERDGETMIKSSDGFSWSIVVRDVSHDTPRLTDDDESVLLTHCNKPENKLLSGKKVSDGLVAYNKGTKTLITPKSLEGFSPVNGALYPEAGADPSVIVQIENKDGSKETTTISVSKPCYAVGQANGIWVAAGGDDNSFSIDVSTDNGKTWTHAYDGAAHDIGGGLTGALPAACVIAGKGSNGT